ncbi:hypothetical protein N7532_000158 [Penicillium argentinense]|uniref:Uncharacterized protein n=1 Tax=Penicillium argentinense TaxID=1131581 RepID=A0A9W9G536_9EURO|nr:uncharacterized protein N7532_000158 [Penicillium argentinense]KAJ5112113.1 hypothetical protein N7532_000158 [Penicillium argentinense]
MSGAEKWEKVEEMWRWESGDDVGGVGERKRQRELRARPGEDRRQRRRDAHVPKDHDLPEIEIPQWRDEARATKPEQRSRWGKVQELAAQKSKSHAPNGD